MAIQSNKIKNIFFRIVNEKYNNEGDIIFFFFSKK